MLYHIVTNYNRLANTTFFLQGNPFFHQTDILDRIRESYDVPTSLTSQYAAHFPDKCKRYGDKIETVNGYTVRYGDVRYFGAKTPDETKEPLQKLWNKVFDCPQPDNWIFGYSAQYAVPKHYILRRPLCEWEHLLNQVCKKELSAYCMEALWYYLFTTTNKLKI